MASNPLENLGISLEAVRDVPYVDVYGALTREVQARLNQSERPDPVPDADIAEQGDSNG